MIPRPALVRASANAKPSVAIAVAIAVSAGAGCDSCKDKPGAAVGTVDGAPTNADPDAAPVNATPVPTASVLALVNPSKLPAYTGPTGSVEGTVTVTGEPAPATPHDFGRCPDAERTWGKAFRESPERSLADAIVAVTGYSGFYIPEKEEAKVVTIEGCAYTARTVTLTFGQRLEIKNTTDDFWTPILEPGPTLVMMMATPKGDPVRIYPKKPGHWLLLDRDRKYAVVDVYAFLHPLHTATDIAGKYRIDGVPVGKVKVNARHPRFDDETTVEIDVKPSVVHKVDLVLKYRGVDAGKTYDSDSGVPVLR